MSPFNTRSLISPSYPTSKSESFDDEVKEKKYPTSKSESFDDEVKEKKIELMIDCLPDCRRYTLGFMGVRLFCLKNYVKHCHWR